MNSFIWIVAFSPLVRAAWKKVLSLILSLPSIHIESYFSVTEFPKDYGNSAIHILFGSSQDEEREFAAYEIWKERARDFEIIKLGTDVVSVARIVVVSYVPENDADPT